MTGLAGTSGSFAANLRGRRFLLVGLASLLLFATLGEGGGESRALLCWHAGLVVLVVWTLLAHRSAGDAPSLPAGRTLTLGTLFLVLAAAGAMLAPYAYAAWLTGLELAACLAVSCLGARLGTDLVSFLRWPLGLGALIQASYVVWQRVALGDTRPAGSFLNTNHMAAWMVMVLLLFGGGYRSLRSPAARIVAVMIVLFAATALWLSGSRGALLGLVVATAWLLWHGWSSLPRAGRIAVLLTAAVLITLAGVRQIGRLEDPDPFRYQRLRIWKASSGAFLAEPWWGSGPGQFETAAKRFQFPDREGPLRHDRRFAITHSDLLRVPCEFGAPAALVLLAAIGWAIRELRRRRRNGTIGTAQDGALAALIAIGVQALVDNPSRWPAVYLLTCTLLGSLLATPPRSPSSGPGQTRLAPAVRVTLALLLLLSFVVGDVGPTMAHLAVGGLPHGRLTERQHARLGLARQLNPAQPAYDSRQAEALIDHEGDWDLALYAAAREAAEQAVRLHPTEAAYEWGLARVEALGCLRLFRDAATRERALTHFERAHERSPADARIAIDAGEFLLSAADPHRARRLAERALRIEPNAVPARLLLAEALLDSGEPDAGPRAEALLAEALELAARWQAVAARGRYQAEMLSVDPARADRIQGKAAALHLSPPG